MQRPSPRYADLRHPLGLKTRVLTASDDQLIVHAEAPVGELARGPTSAYGGVKRLLWHDHQPPYEEMEVENESIADTARTADAQEGIAAFLAKRLPQSTRVRDSA